MRRGDYGYDAPYALIMFGVGSVVFAVLAIFLIRWILDRTTLGFEIRTVGANPNAARYAGMSITRNYIIALCLSGALAGLFVLLLAVEIVQRSMVA